MSFSPKNFVDGVGPDVSAAWLNQLDQMANNALQGATTLPALQLILGITAPITLPLPVNEGGTGQITSAAGLAALGGTSLAAVLSTINQTYLGNTLYPPTSYEIAAATFLGITLAALIINPFYPELDMRRYGADLTGLTSCDTAIRNGLYVACPIVGSPINARYLYFPAGQYRLTQTINATNSRTTNTLQTDSLRIVGDSAGGTYWFGYTGANHAFIETTGAQWLTIENVTMQDPGTTGRSTVGIFQGIGSSLNQTQNQRYSRVNIFMNDNPGVNGGAGSIGIWNYGSEECTYDTVYVLANLPLMFTGHNPDTSTGFTTPTSYQSLTASHSVGVTTFAGECFIVSQAKRQPSIITVDVNSFKFENVYMANSGLVGSNQSAWKVYGALTGVDFNGTIESHARLFEITGIVQGANARVTFGGIDSAGTEHILLNRGGQGQMDGCNITIFDNVFTARPLFAAAPSGTNELITCFLRNSYFRTNLDKQYLGIQENVLWNPSTGNVTLEGYHNTTQCYRYLIDANRAQEVAIPDTAILINGGITNAEIVRFILPTVVGSANALGAVITIEGLAHVNGSGSSSYSVIYLRAEITIALSNITGIVTTVGADYSGAPTNQGGESITGVVFSATSGGGGAYVQIIATATRTGGTEQVNFSGTAKLKWNGNESRAPSLQTLS